MEFGILGPLEVKRATAVVPVDGPRQRRLLAILLLNRNAVVPLDQLIEQLWEDPPPSARQQMHNAVARLRRGLAAPGEADTVHTTDVGYRIQLNDEQLDVQRFTTGVRAAEMATAQGNLEDAVARLSAALAQWRGPALAGLEGHLITSAGARLNEQRLTATERLLGLRSDLGEYDAVLGELTELLARHPLRDSLRALLMLTYHRAGRRHDALAVYEAGRRLLARELGLDPSPELRALHQRVLRADSGLLPTSAGQHTEVSRKSFLPHAPKVFVGRARELNLIVSEVHKPAAAGPAVLSIDGMGGIGKTALALRAAHLLAERYPDGQYFVDLHGFSRQRDPVTAAAALELLLRVAGFSPERIHPDLDGRAAQWRGHVTGRRVLIVLDNANDESQVRPLIPGTPAAAVLVTSRRRLVGIEELLPVSLDVLPVEDAVTLLWRMSCWPAPAGETAGSAAAAVSVVQVCGLLPLAIRIAASRLRNDPGVSIEYLADLLGDEQRLGHLLTAGDRDVFGELTLSCERLSGEARRFFKMLALHPRTGFDRLAAAGTAGVSSVEAEHRLDELVNANLVVRQTMRQYRVPGLLYDLARSLSHQHQFVGEPVLRPLPA